MFEGLEKLEHFSIENMNHVPNKSLTLQNELFQNMKLTNLQIQACIDNSSAIVNITGSNLMDSVIIIDYRFNKLTTLLDFSFVGVPNTTIIFLDDCAIEIIELHAFVGLIHLQALHLQNNHIKAVDKSPFSWLESYESWPQQLYLFNNPFICDCCLRWMIGTVLNYQIIKCTNQISNASSSCGIDQQGQMNLDCYLTKQQCSETSNSLCSVPQTTAQPETTTVQLTTEESSTCPTENGEANCVPTMNITKITTSSLEIQLLNDDKCKRSNKKLSLIWLNSNNTSNINCTSIDLSSLVHRSHNITSLETDSEYLVCLTEDSNGFVSPENCLGVRTEKLPEKKTLIQHKHKKLFFCLLCSFIVVITIMFTIGWYFFFNRYPHLLKNKNVVVTDNSSLRKSTNSRNNLISYENSVNDNCPNNSDSKSNYLTPIAIRAGIRRRSLSQGSSFTMYEEIGEPRLNRWMSWRIARLQKDSLKKKVERDSRLPGNKVLY